MENKLYWYTYNRKIQLKTGDTYHFYKDNYKINYGAPEERTKIITKWDELVKEVTNSESNKNRKGSYIYVGYFNEKDSWREKKLYKEEFKEAEIWNEYVILDTKTTRFGSLIDNLTVDEMTQFLKDNEISYLPYFKR